MFDKINGMTAGNYQRYIREDVRVQCNISRARCKQKMRRSCVSVAVVISPLKLQKVPLIHRAELCLCHYEQLDYSDIRLTDD